MTLILSMITQDAAVLVADRRLTASHSARGVLVVDDDAPKAAVIFVADGRLGLSMTGLARVPQMRASGNIWRWVMTQILDCATPDYSVLGTAHRLPEVLSATYKALLGHRVKPADRRLTIVLSGFEYGERGSRAVSFVISNYWRLGDVDEVEARDDFDCTSFLASADSEVPAQCALALGDTASLATAERQALVELVKQGKPAVALVNRGVGAIRHAADRSRGTVGKRCMSLVIPRDPQSAAVSEYHPEGASATMFGLDEIHARGGGSGAFVVSDPKIWYGDASSGAVQPPAATPRLGRNTRCWCGSGRKYKDCCGRTGSPKGK